MNAQEMVNVFKWLKLLHKERPSAPLTADQPGTAERLYRDVQLCVGHFSLQLCDDPFEVALRDK